MRKLYILIRTDLDSMTPGRIAAQASHATSYFEMLVNIPFDKDNHFVVAYNQWRNQTEQNFGTVIVLNGGTSEEIKKITDALPFGYIAGTIIDPDYPIRDGQHIWSIKDVHTCSFVFWNGPEDEDTYLKNMKLL